MSELTALSGSRRGDCSASIAPGRAVISCGWHPASYAPSRLRRRQHDHDAARLEPPRRPFGTLAPDVEVALEHSASDPIDMATCRSVHSPRMFPARCQPVARSQ
jgi:hypothetical protein